MPSDRGVGRGEPYEWGTDHVKDDGAQHSKRESSKTIEDMMVRTAQLGSSSEARAEYRKPQDVSWPL